jgi:hypothetical protein
VPKSVCGKCPNPATLLFSSKHVRKLAPKE